MVLKRALFPAVLYLALAGAGAGAHAQTTHSHVENGQPKTRATQGQAGNQGGSGAAPVDHSSRVGILRENAGAPEGWGGFMRSMGVNMSRYGD